MVPIELVKQAAFTPSTVSGLRGWNLHPEYWLQIPRVTTSWQPARSTCTIRADNGCIWDSRHFMADVISVLCIHSSISKSNEQAEAPAMFQVCGRTSVLQRLYFGMRRQCKKWKFLKTPLDYHTCQGCHRCDEKQVNGNYRE